MFKKLYWPICRAYSRKLGDKPADSILRIMCSIEFWRTYHFWPNFVDPCRFSEKVWSRQLHERDPLYTMISDKFKVRDYVAAHGGAEYLIPLLWNGPNPEDIPFDDMPITFVIKATHGCGYNIIINDNSVVDRIGIKRKLNKWLKTNFGASTFLGIAWGYKNIIPQLIVEKFLGEKGKAPVDYKFFCFSGRMEFFKIDFDRFEGHSERFFDRELNELDLVEVGLKLYSGKIEFPENLSEMIHLAETLSTEFNFIRVDLYSIGNQIFFSELTPYPGGTSCVLKPNLYDFSFGSKWGSE